MAEIKYVTGDATIPVGLGRKAIIHACNDAGSWTKGFVESVSKRWQEPEQQFRSWVRKKADFVLGKIQIVEVESNISVINMLCQHGVGFGRKLDLFALEKCFFAIVEHYENSAEKFTVHMPRICKGMTGSNWPIVENLLNKIMIPAGITVIVYDWKK